MWIDRYYYRLHHPDMPDSDELSVSFCPSGRYQVGDVIEAGPFRREVVEVVPRIREANDYLTRKFEDAILQQVAGTMALSGMELTEEDRARILHLLRNPEDEGAILRDLIEKHRKGVTE